MTEAKLINKRFIIELLYDGCEYHLTMSSDLKDLFDIDCLSGEQKHYETELIEAVQGEFFNHRLDLDSL